MIKVCLFVGGICDGQRVEVNLEQRLVAMREKSPAEAVSRSEAARIVESRVVMYRQNLFTTHTPKKDFYLYAPEDWTADMVFMAMIEKYPVAK